MSPVSVPLKPGRNCPGTAGQRPRVRLLASALVVTILAIVALVATACSDDSGSRVADRAHSATTTADVPTSSAIGPPTTAPTVPATTTSISSTRTTDTLAGGGGGYAAQLIYAECMQAHGIDIPNPPAGGGPATQSKVIAGAEPIHLDATDPNTRGSGGIDPNSPQFIAATSACQSLLPAGSGPSTNYVPATNSGTSTNSGPGGS